MRDGFFPEVRDPQWYGYGPWFPLPDVMKLNVSDKCRDFISKMLKTETWMRLSAEECREHTWMDILHEAELAKQEKNLAELKD